MSNSIRKIDSSVFVRLRPAFARDNHHFKSLLFIKVKKFYTILCHKVTGICLRRGSDRQKIPSMLVLFYTFSSSRRGRTNCGNGDGDQDTAQLRKPPSAPRDRRRMSAPPASASSLLPSPRLPPLRSRHHSLHARSQPPQSVSQSAWRRRSMKTTTVTGKRRRER